MISNQFPFQFVKVWMKIHVFESWNNGIGVVSCQVALFWLPGGSTTYGKLTLTPFT